MKYLFDCLILVLINNLIIAPKPENITLFQLDSYGSKHKFYEFTVFKNEIFGFEFARGRGTPYNWEDLNKNLTETNNLQFLYSTYYDFLAEMYEKQLELYRQSSIRYYPHPMTGGTEYYYKVYKAIGEGNQPQALKYTYSAFSNILTEVDINIWICDEIYKDECINNNTMKCVYDIETKKCSSKILCDKIINISKSNCENGITSTPSLTKCTYEKTDGVEKCAIKNLCTNSFSEEECNSAVPLNSITSYCIYDEEEKICKEEKKFCHEIDEEVTEDICKNAEAFDLDKKCVFDKENHFCIEIDFDIKDKGKYLLNINYLLLILYLMIFI